MDDIDTSVSRRQAFSDESIQHVRAARMFLIFHDPSVYYCETLFIGTCEFNP